MRHNKQPATISGRQCTILSEPDARPCPLIVQPADSHDLEGMEDECAWIEEHCAQRFNLVAIHITRWFDELAPWPAPPVFGKTPFGDGAPETLRLVTGGVIPFMADRYAGGEGKCDKKGTSLPVILGGYSLAGLFALWAGSRYAFDGIVAASPSVWYKGFMDYAHSHPMLTHRVYLSLGDRETHTKTKVMARVGECLDEDAGLLRAQGADVLKEMNPGNHFQDNAVRTAKGFAWCLSSIRAC